MPMMGVLQQQRQRCKLVRTSDLGISTTASPLFKIYFTGYPIAMTRSSAQIDSNEILREMPLGTISQNGDRQNLIRAFYREAS